MAKEFEAASFVHLIEDHGNKLLNNLHFQWMNEDFCDLIIVAKGKSLPVHACVMAAFSPKIANLISRQMLQNRAGASHVYKVNVKFKYDIMESVVTAIYTGVFQPPRDILREVQLAVEWLKISEFINAIKRQVGDPAQEIKEEDHVNNSSKECHFEAEYCSQTRPSTEVSCITNMIDSAQELDVNAATWNNESILDRIQKKSALIRILTSDVVADIPLSRNTDNSKNIIELSEIKTEVEETNDNNHELITDKQNMTWAARKSKHLKPNNFTLVPSKQNKNVLKLNTKKRKEKSKQQKSSSGNGVKTRTKLNNPGRKILDLASGKKSNKFSLQAGKLTVGLKAEENLETSIIEEVHNDDPVKEELELLVGNVGFIKCKKCCTKFANLDEYKSHILNHPILKCDQCDQTFFSKFSLNKHIRLVHIGIVHLVCRHCHFQAQSQIELRKHTVDVHNDKKPFSCSYKDCKFSSARYFQLIKHLAIHKEQKEYMCDKCSMSFLREVGLICHQRACYKLQEFLCDLCGQSFNHKQSMKNHRQVMHFGEKPFKCSVCSSPFGDRRNLRRHMRVHENSFPYVCAVCQQKFRHSNTLKMHIASKHKDLPETIQKSFYKQKGPGGNSYKRTLKKDFTNTVTSKIRLTRGRNCKKGQSKGTVGVSTPSQTYDSASFTGEYLTSPEDSIFDISNGNGLDFVVDTAHPVAYFTTIAKPLEVNLGNQSVF